MKWIHNVRELRRALRGGHREFRLLLADGAAFSRKTITLLRDGRFRVVNHIDDSVQKLSGRQLYSRSNIGQGMRWGSLVCPPLSSSD
jgi:hypothetical protein